MFIAGYPSVLTQRRRYIGALSLRDDTPFDGQYIHASATDGSTEWWWVQATGTLNGQTVGVHLTFYQGRLRYLTRNA